MSARPRREDLPYRDCVGIALFNRNGEVFVGRRKLDTDPEESAELGSPWQMPQGGIDPGEAPLPAALRELAEETGITSVSLIAEAPDWVFYDLPEEVLGAALGGKYRGQRQRWFAFAFDGDESEIDVLAPGGGQYPAEFDAWRWERLEELPRVVVAFKRDAYTQVVAAFKDVPDQLRSR